MVQRRDGLRRLREYDDDDDMYLYWMLLNMCWWLGSRVDSVLDSGAEGPGFKSRPRRCRVTVLGKLCTPIVPLLTKQRNWQQPS